MSEIFDPYYKWLGIPPKDQPPNHYRLLGVDLFEHDPDVIDSAAEQRMAHVRSFQTGKHAAESQKLLNGIAAAKFCLLSAPKKAAYDDLLRRHLSAIAAKARPQPPAARPPLPIATAAQLPVAQPLQARPAVSLRQPAPASQPAQGSDPFDFGELDLQSSLRGAGPSRGKNKAIAVAAVVVVVCVAAISVGAIWLFNNPKSHTDGTEVAATSGSAPTANPPESAPPPSHAPAEKSPSVIELSTPTKPLKPTPRPAAPRATIATVTNNGSHGALAPAPRDPAIAGQTPAVESGASGREGVTPDTSPAIAPSSRPAADTSAVPPKSAAQSETDDQQPPREPVPTDSALADAAKQIKQLYKNDFAAAKSTAQKVELAKTLLQKAMTVQADRTSLFALLEAARDMSAHSGDCRTAMSAIDQMSSVFRIDASKMKASALAKCAPLASSRFHRRLLAQKAAEACEGAFAADDFADARKLALLAQAVARTGGETRLVKWSAAELASIDEAAQAFEPMKEAKATLAKNAADTTANLVVGKYQCLIKGNWDSGLPKLAGGSDPALQRMAKAELGGGISLDDRRKIADGWWSLAATQGGNAKRAMQAHAAFWFQQSLAAFDGLERDKIEKRIATVGESRPKLTISAKVFATADDDAIVYLNGNPLVHGALTHGAQADCELAPGDTLTVKAINYAGAYGFYCGIKLDDGTTIRTSMNSGWSAYVPADGAKWFDPLAIGRTYRISHGNSNIVPSDSAKLEFGLGGDSQIWGKGDVCYLVYVVQ